MTPDNSTPPSPPLVDIEPSPEGSQSSSDRDVSREEEPWNRRNEALIVNWLEESRVLKHDTWGNVCEVKHRRWALPAVLLPTIMAPVSATFHGQSWARYLDMSAFLATAIASAISTFYNYGGLAERHYKASACFADLSTDIEECLTKNRRFRPAADIFVQGAKIRFDELNKQGPRLPQHINVEVQPWRLDMSKSFKQVRLEKKRSTYSSSSGGP